MKRRHKHSLSHYRLATFDMGELVPVGLLDVLPGDSFQHASSVLLRVSPLLAPVMHPISVRLHHFFVPYRLLWTEWEKFITGGPDGLGASTAVPTITMNAAQGSLADYLGVPTGVAGLVVSAFPFRAYGAIYNEFFRDKDLQSELVVSTAGGNDATTNTTLQRIAWEKDTFTAARPWPQKGPNITLPLGTTATVKTNATDLVTGAQNEMKVRGAAGGAVPNGNILAAYNTTRFGESGTAASGTIGQGLYPTNLYADLAAATAVDVNTVRRAFALQRYQEARAQFGHEYVDYLRYAFGVRSSDARMQNPEYLGGGKQTIAFSEILQTGSDTDNTGVGDLRGHGIAAMRSNRYRRYFEEHGLVITLMSVRPRSMYASGLHRSWFKTTKEDFYQHELEMIGQQAVLNKEVYAAHGTPAGTFGYQDRYSEYRSQPSHVHGDFRSTLNYWHLARILAAPPALNSAFITCDPGKRIHAEQSADSLWVMVNHSVQARRAVGNASVGKVL